MNDNELMNRRRFFKKTAKEMLPMLGTFVAAPTVIMGTLTSCGDDCVGCEAACRDNCVGACSDSCSNYCYDSCLQDCADGCKESCSDGCLSSCEGISTGVPSIGNVDQHEYVDLGLSVLWATKNMGANSETEIGNYYPFVFPDDKEDDSWVNRFNNLGLKEGASISGTNLDTAKNGWGIKWRMPNSEEIEELCKNCDVELVESTGLKLISRINGNTIFFPFLSSGTDDEGNKKWEASYWSGTIKYGPNPSTKSASACILRITWPQSSIGANAFGSSELIYWYYTNWSMWMITNGPIRPITERNYGNVATCNGSCTANCSSDCSSTCKNVCIGTCKGSCGNDCTGGCKDGCSTGCQTTCKDECKEKCTKTCADSCYSDCTNGCTTTCADACKAQTSQYCSNCASNCSSGCTTNCADACKAQTSQGCSNCATQCSGDCQHECTYGCGRQCYTSCGGQCKGKCGGSCQVECVSYAKNTPCASCGGTCRSACNETCTYDCYSTCKSIGYK